ncbi:MAG: ABC transporter ATP-binding protein [Gammaproteobacteria bacterium]|nr:ABC transporter ATP-binding protein [Gammaproteobacteria bacterium]MDH5727747.1 ABC transporter ATP-binding protein [Gammaproteobacteria bacterium]
MQLRVRESSLACLLGPSGCGKSTVLRAIAGLEPVHSGEIRLRHKLLSRPGFTLTPEKREVGMVFQDYALFPHLDVAANIRFGLRGERKSEQQRIEAELLELVGLSHLAQRYPHELSGGQQQRVALARALAAQPQLILMDEPFSNLDVELRERLALEVRDILKARGITGILVTHDQSEAFAVSDMIAVMHEGQVQQWDTAFNLYHDPVNRFVADFIGQGVFLRGELVQPDTVQTELGLIKGDRAYHLPLKAELDVLVRPDDILPDPEGPLRAKITNKAFKGAETIYTLELSTGSRLLTTFPSHHDYQLGEQVGVRADIQHLIAFPVDTQ